MEIAEQLTGAATISAADGAWIYGHKVDWLPSVPLVKKYKAPSIAGYGIFYSEDLEKVLKVFATKDLSMDLKKNWREQAIALGVDPNCRVHWLETDVRETFKIVAASVSANCG